MANPFGDCDDEEYERYQTKSRGNSIVGSSKLNPFGEPEELEHDKASNHSSYANNTNRNNINNSYNNNISNNNNHNDTTINNSFHNLTVGSSRQMSYSRQSLDSNPNSDAQSISSNSYLGNYTLGEGSVEKEGLFCPECFEEFRQITDMIEHVEKFHSANSSGTSKGSQLKGFFSKIKTKAQSQIIPNFDRSESVDEKNFDPSFNPTEDWKLQMAPGPRRSHFSEFKRTREIRIERFVLETNKLLIRLDKLLRDYPFDGDSNTRRTYEQSIVSWIDESLVNLCPTCTIRFNILTRKKHHCRLCGAVMCTKCSKFITFSDAYKLVGSVGVKVDERKQRLSVTPSGGAKVFSKLVEASPLANDLVGQFDAKLDSVRICYECDKLMVMRLDKIERAQVTPVIVQLYGQLREQVDKFDRQLPVFIEMAESINNGNSTHSQSDLQNSKRSLTRTGEMLDLISKKIEVCGLIPAKRRAEMDPLEVQRTEPSNKQQNLQRNIRRATVLYLKKLQQAHSIAIQSVQH